MRTEHLADVKQPNEVQHKIWTVVLRIEACEKWDGVILAFVDYSEKCESSSQARKW